MARGKAKPVQEKPATEVEVEPKLTDKQEMFIRHYLVSLNATDAARKAGYQGDYLTLKSVGCENLTKPYIKERIKVAMNAAAMPPEEVLMRLSQQARGEHSQFWQYDEDGRRLHLNFEALQEAGLGHLIKEFECHELTGNVTKVKFYDAQAALKLIGTHHKMFTEKTEVSGTITHEHNGHLSFEEARELPADELAGRLREALGEVAETSRRW